MKKQSSECKEHVQLIEQLLNQNTMLKQKYEKLLKQYDLLSNKYNRLSQNPPLITKAPLEQNDELQDISDMILESTLHSEGKGGRQSKNFDVELGDINFQDLQFTQERKSKQKVQIKEPEINPFERTSKQIKSSLLTCSRSSSRSSSVFQKFFPLIEGCFIIEKKKCYKDKQKNALSQMLEFIYPEELAKTQKQTLQMMLKYTFINPDILISEDDQFSSRKNQIMFGTPYEDYMYAFEDGKWMGKRQLPEIMKLMGTMKKKYYHILVRPDIVQKEELQKQSEVKEQGSGQGQGQIKIEQMEALEQEEIKQNEQKPEYFYETQVIYGFVSSFPLRVFFQDIHRTIQQELKYSQFEVDENKQQVYNPTKNRKNKYKIMGKIMKRLYDEQYKINKFPINIRYATGITSITINIPTLVSYRDMEDQFLNHVLAKYDSGKVFKLLHYVLAEKCILVEVEDRKALNELFEMIRIFIRPFLWIFAIVYVYSDYFQPFMSSPMPIIIGKVVDSQEQQQENKTQTRQSSLDYSEFCHIKMDDEQLQLKQSEPFYKSIRKLKKQWQKAEANKKQTRAGFIHSYVHSLRIFIQKGVLNVEPTDFHIEFIETQMVSYFKDTKDEE